MSLNEHVEINRVSHTAAKIISNIYKLFIIATSLFLRIRINMELNGPAHLPINEHKFMKSIF